jgi:hypothetical protein
VCNFSAWKDSINSFFNADISYNVYISDDGHQWYFRELASLIKNSK